MNLYLLKQPTHIPPTEPLTTKDYRVLYRPRSDHIAIR